MAAPLRFLPSPSASQEPNYDVNATVDFWVLLVRGLQRQQEYALRAALGSGRATLCSVFSCRRCENM
jgi:hypothetical protein